MRLSGIVILLALGSLVGGCNIFGTGKEKPPEYLWNKKSGLPNSRISNIALNDDNVLLVSTSKGLYRAESINGSLEKIPLLNILAITPFRNIFVRDSLFYITTYPNNTLFPTNEIWSSRYGKKWKRVSSQKDPIFDILITSRGVRLLGTWHGVYRRVKGSSEDELIKFFYTEYLPGLDRISTLVETSSGAILGGTHDGIYRSLDDGTTWQKVSDEIHKDNDEIIAQYIDPENRIFAQSRLGLFQSTDDGESWNKLGEVNELGNTAIFARNGTVVVTGGGIIEKASLTDGKFQKIETGLSHNFRELAVTDDGKIVIATDSSVYIGKPNPEYRD